MADFSYESDYGGVQKFLFGVGLQGNDDSPDTPIQTVFFLFKVLFINLVLGCIFTTICLSSKRYICKCLQFFFCGLCAGCDCDYDGSYSSRSKQPARRVRKSKRSSEEYDEPVCYTIWLICKSLYWNKNLLSKIFLVMVGMTVAYALLQIRKSIDTNDPLTSVYSFSDYTLFSNDDGDLKNRVFFVTPTSPTGIQIAKLTKIAQALYQSRNFVTWVVVSSDPVMKMPWYPVRTEHWNLEQISRWSGDESCVMTHLEDLHRTLSRFGIPFVILSAHKIHHMNLGFTSYQMKSPRTLSTFMKASQIGLTWIVKTFQTGVVVLGPDDGVYDFRLFREVQGTKLMSSWPTVFDPRYSFSLSTPVLREDNNVTKGYLHRGKISSVEIPFQYASSAVSIKLMKQLHAEEELWKLTIDSQYGTNDLGLQNYHVQPLANNCSEIFVWKTGTFFTYSNFVHRTKIPLKYKWLHTNIVVLHAFIGKSFFVDFNGDLNNELSSYKNNNSNNGLPNSNSSLIKFKIKL